jgi:hypothetical protein
MPRSAILLSVLLCLAGCGDEPTATAEHRDIAGLRAATAPFADPAAAHLAGYAVQFPEGCFQSDEGAMGFHYINESLVGTLDPTKPQLVIYEPRANGGLQLVGVEFIVPGSSADTPPRLFDRSFSWNPQFEVWMLHVWLWRHNPAGMFANWNAAVSCAHAGNASPTRHH